MTWRKRAITPFFSCFFLKPESEYERKIPPKQDQLAP